MADSVSGDIRTADGTYTVTLSHDDSLTASFPAGLEVVGDVSIRYGRLRRDLGAKVLPSTCEMVALDPEGEIAAVFSEALSGGVDIRVSVNGTGVKWRGFLAPRAPVTPITRRTREASIGILATDRVAEYKEKPAPIFPSLINGDQQPFRQALLSVSEDVVGSLGGADIYSDISTITEGGTEYKAHNRLDEYSLPQPPGTLGELVEIIARVLDVRGFLPLGDITGTIFKRFRWMDRRWIGRAVTGSRIFPTSLTQDVTIAASEEALTLDAIEDTPDAYRLIDNDNAVAIAIGENHEVLQNEDFRWLDGSSPAPPRFWDYANADLDYDFDEGGILGIPASGSVRLADSAGSGDPAGYIEQDTDRLVPDGGQGLFVQWSAEGLGNTNAELEVKITATFDDTSTDTTSVSGTDALVDEGTLFAGFSSPAVLTVRFGGKDVRVSDIRVRLGASQYKVAETLRVGSGARALEIESTAAPIDAEGTGGVLLTSGAPIDEYKIRETGDTYTWIDYGIAQKKLLTQPEPLRTLRATLHGIYGPETALLIEQPDGTFSRFVIGGGRKITLPPGGVPTTEIADVELPDPTA